MLILGVETSCDETAAAIVQDGVKIISNVVASSQSMHAKFGGIIPEQAAREQVKSIIPVIDEAVSSQQLAVSDIDALAVTIGPGLIGSLLVGVETAKTLALTWNKPIIPVNHLVGHLYANWLIDEKNKPTFPALALLVSGGHTELVLIKDHGRFELIGTTRDDASGECFDKCARVLNLGYPGGPAIEAAASQFDPADGGIKFEIKLPRPLINDKSLDFSFSGLKTAVLNRKTEDPQGLAWELQEAITDVLVKKTLAAAEKYQIKNILLAGGVAANKRLGEKMKIQISNFKFQIEFYVPDIKLCTDNAACVASAAFFNNNPLPWNQIEAIPDLDI